MATKGRFKFTATIEPRLIGTLGKLQRVGKGAREVDAGNAERWSAEALEKIVSEALAILEAQKLTCQEAAERALSTPSVKHLADQYAEHAGKELTPNALARILVERLMPVETTKAAPPAPQRPSPERVLVDLKSLNESAEELAKSAGLARVYGPLNRAADGIRSGALTLPQAIAMVREAAKKVA